MTEHNAAVVRTPDRSAWIDSTLCLVLDIGSVRQLRRYQPSRLTSMEPQRCLCAEARASSRPLHQHADARDNCNSGVVTHPTHHEDGAHPLDAPAAVLCTGCVRRGLDPARSRRMVAQEKLEDARRDAAARLRELMSRRLRMAQWQDEIDQLSSRLADRRKLAGEMAVRVARGAVEVEALQQELHEMSRSIPDREYLHKVSVGVFEGGLQRAIREAQGHEVALRFAWACQAFHIHRMDVVESDPDDRAQIRSGRMKHARGIGKIGGLPLPHAGPELFGVLPPPELESALRLVASATSLVARCLNVALPHPIRLRLECQSTPTQDIICGIESAHGATAPASKESGGTHRSADGATANKTMENLSDMMSTSTASLASLIRGSASSSSALLVRAVRGAVSSAMPTLLEESASSVSSSPAPGTRTGAADPPPSMQPDVVRRRVEHARTAMIAEDGNAATWYRLSVGADEGAKNSPPATLSSSRQDEFATALQLLQSDVIALCIRSGVAIDRLWPAEAFLLNLHELQKHCREQVSVALT
jgi:Vacuolar sorting 38 and autophagy-related subunit 14